MNIEFKTVDCAFMHFIKDRFYFINLYKLNLYAKRHGHKQLGTVEYALMRYCSAHFTQAEKEFIFRNHAKPGDDEWGRLMSKANELIAECLKQ